MYTKNDKYYSCNLFNQWYIVAQIKSERTMIKKVVKKQTLSEHSENSIQDDLEYWLGKSPRERIEAVEYLRRQYYGNSARLQRVARVIQRKSS